MVQLFSVSAFFIVLREVLEACLVVGIALAYFQRTGNTQYNKWVWVGAAAGIAVSFIFGITFAVIFFVNGDQIFKDSAEKIFEGIMFLIAAGLLTWMIIWMMMMGKELRTQLESKLDSIVEAEEKSPRRRKLGVFTMVFVQVLREGIETFIFLFGSASADSVGGWRAIPIPGILAVIVGIGVSFLVFKGLVNADVQTFFDYSSLILIAFAAGLVSHAFHEMQEVDWFGPWEPTEGPRDWYNLAMWKTTNCCNDKTNQFFAMLRALFGYQDKPTFIEWITYFAYWVIVIGIYVWINWDSILAARTATMNKLQLLTSSSLIFTLVGFIFAIGNPSWIGLLTMISAFILSIITVFFVFDAISSNLIKAILPIRKTGLTVLSIAWGILTVLMLALHLSQLICIGEGEGVCSQKNFFFFGLIFTDSFNNLPNTPLYQKISPVSGKEEYEKFTAIYPGIAVLSISLIITMFFFGALTFRLLLASWNITPEGEYMDDEYVAVNKEVNVEETEEIEPEIVPEVSP